MLQVEIRLKSVNDVKEFVRLARQFPYAITLRSEKYSVTGKSLMGVYSLDLSKNVMLETDLANPALLERFGRFFAGDSGKIAVNH